MGLEITTSRSGVAYFTNWARQAPIFGSFTVMLFILLDSTLIVFFSILDLILFTYLTIFKRARLKSLCIKSNICVSSGTISADCCFSCVRAILFLCVSCNCWLNLDLLNDIIWQLWCLTWFEDVFVILFCITNQCFSFPLAFPVQRVTCSPFHTQEHSF